ncbi:MAG TPA: hypothetical protein VFB22_08035 [Candidatus Baltobacteraceae bacterium]|nr:hypothetical protein [Candidatus Baltobacteraceae bacterium]
MLASVLLAAALVPAPSTTPTPSPKRILGLIREAFHAHRPPPPYETYTLIRAQKATNGYPDPTGSYTVHFWVRNSDRAALSRMVYRDDARGDLTFDRPAFNEDRDPGPPTADVFEPAPAHPRPITEAPTPEPAANAALPVIGGVRALLEFDYQVVSMDVEGDELHLKIEPIRDVERNRLRELWVDKRTYELHKLVATDKLFLQTGGKGPVYPVVFTVTMGDVQGYPVVTDIHGVVGGGYDDDGRIVDYKFRDITFPATLPAWYFDPRTYAQHKDDAPS